jgi:hypothetical protein
MQKRGLEFEREYSVALEGYRYVYYFSCKEIKTIFYNALYVARSWSGMIF